MGKQLYRPKNNRVVAGVCAGLGEYFDIDPTLVRIVTIIISIAGGAGLFAYIVAAIIMPDESKIYPGRDNWKTGADNGTEEFVRDHEREKNEWDQPVKYSSEKSKLLMGAILVSLGVIFLVKQFIPAFDMKFLIPLLLIGLGGIIILKGR